MSTKRTNPPSEARAVLLTIAELLEAPRDRFGRLDLGHTDAADARRARETLRNFAVKHAVGGCKDILEQAAKVARAALK